MFHVHCHLQQAGILFFKDLDSCIAGLTPFLPVRLDMLETVEINLTMKLNNTLSNMKYVCFGCFSI